MFVLTFAYSVILFLNFYVKIFLLLRMAVFQLFYMVFYSFKYDDDLMLIEWLEYNHKITK